MIRLKVTTSPRQLPSRGWGPWRQEFYSIFSGSQSIAEDVKHEHGIWHNVWIQKISSFIYNRWPNLWRIWMNWEPIRRRYVHKLHADSDLLVMRK